VKETLQEKQEFYWTTCPLSSQPLKPPVVSDSAGYLYNKDSVLEFLLPSDDPNIELAKKDKEAILEGRICGLKDVVEVKFTVEEGSNNTQNGKESSPESRWVCSVTNKALGPGVKSVYIVPCGHTFSETAIKEVSDEHCLQCNESYTADNVIGILPTALADQERLANRIRKLKDEGLTHSLKKASGGSKKRKKHVEIAGTGKVSTGTSTPTDSIQNAATASITAKVLAEEQGKAKRRKVEANDNLKSLFSTSSSKQKDGDFMTRGFSIPAGAKH